MSEKHVSEREARIRAEARWKRWGVSCDPDMGAYVALNVDDDPYAGFADDGRLLDLNEGRKRYFDVEEHWEQAEALCEAHNAVLAQRDEAVRLLRAVAGPRPATVMAAVAAATTAREVRDFLATLEGDNG